MSNSIPKFDHNLVLPPHLGNPSKIEDLSPYKCTSVEFCERFATSVERIKILIGFIEFREKLHKYGLVNGFQWLDGSFLEDVENREKRPPNDLDLVTIYWGYELFFLNNLMEKFPEFGDNILSKKEYFLDHYLFDAHSPPEFTIYYIRYWLQFFSHNRDAVWKGMLQISLNTPTDDEKALQFLKTK